MVLKDIRVIELAGLAPVPFCGKILSDFGADVIRVDRPKSLDIEMMDARKRSIILNLKKQSGVDAVRRLCSSADVIIDPYRPGVLERLTLGPKELMTLNPRLIYARISGFGQTGPLSGKAGHDINYVALSGVLSMLGRKESVPTPPINLIADFAGGGLLCALGITMALFERTKTGVGKVVDSGMSEGAAYISSFLYSSKDSYIWGNPRGSNVLDSGAHFYDTYETKDGRYMAVGAIEPQFYAALLKGLELKEEDVPHLSNFDQNKKILTDKFKEKTMKEWTNIFDELDACVAPVLSMDEAPYHPHNRERSNFIQVRNKKEPRISPILTDKDGNISDSIKRSLENNPPCPDKGEHSVDVLKEIGYSTDEIEKVMNDAGIRNAKL